ncbi:hypothetical protein BHM03_00008541 [Ensete ventricosum]|nr:hypothetical protein BHM03_00008541 [Ensete ventricosum]
MHWVKADAFDFGGNPPLARRVSSCSRGCSGHTAVNVGKSKVVVFGGFADKRFLDDIAVYDIGILALLPLSKHLMEREGIVKVECTGSGSDGQVGPSPRAFHVAVAIDCNMFIFGGRSGSKRYGGWDGKKWLSDVYILDTRGGGPIMSDLWALKGLIDEESLHFYLLLSVDDPIAKRFPSTPSAPPESQSITVSDGLAESSLKVI